LSSVYLKESWNVDSHYAAWLLFDSGFISAISFLNNVELGISIFLSSSLMVV